MSRLRCPCGEELSSHEAGVVQAMQVDCSDSDWIELADVEVWACPVCGRLAAFDDEQNIRWHVVEKDGWVDPKWRETKGLKETEKRRKTEYELADLKREKAALHKAAGDLLTELGDYVSPTTDRLRNLLNPRAGMPS